METCTWIIHIGHPINSHTYDHRIDRMNWTQILTNLKGTELEPKPVPITLYHLGGLTYEVNSMSGEVIQCYMDTISDLVEHATNLTYQRHRTQCSSLFSPINKYYNCESLERIILPLGSNLIRLECEFQPDDHQDDHPDHQDNDGRRGSHGEVIFEMINLQEIEKYQSILKKCELLSLSQ